VTLVALSGSSRGIGRATALALAERGAALALLARPSPEQRELEARLERANVRFTTFACDLEDPESTLTACHGIVERCGTPGAVIANAGAIERALVVETSPESFQRQLAVNLTAPFLMAKAFLPSMLSAGRGRLVFLGSISSTLGTAGAAAYCASKWGLVGFMKSLAEELRDTGLMTVVLLPGSTDTQMLEGSGFPARMTPDDVAKSLVHYALDAPGAHNGSVIEMFGV
jgi:3-oxoacyl-[acyl-carrier protein] reductase